MGKKRPAPRQWIMKSTSSYHRERDERIARAYELIIPIVSQLPKPHLKEEVTNETLITDRPLRTRVQ
jgi:hypothetical protein